MKKLILTVLAVMLVSVGGYCEDIAQAPKEFGGMVVGIASLSAVVEAIDYNTREVALKDAQGQVALVKAGPEIKNFAQINKGDKVNIDYSQTVKIVVSPTAVVPARQESVEVSRAPLGEKPAGVATTTSQVIAKVVNMDYLKRIITLKGPQRTVEVQVNESAENFINVKIGDTVYLEYTEQLAISVTK